MLAGILAIFKAVPILNSWFEKLVAAYISHQIDSMKAENVAAIRKVLDEKDQRALEKALASPTAGLPSGDAGSVIIDGPPPNVGRVP